jgi:oligopeptide transport system substrate-binding protein
VRSKGMLRLAVGAAAVMVVASGCSGGQQRPGASGAKGVGDGGELKVQIVEPRHLVSTTNTDSEGGAVARAIYSGLIRYAGDDYKIVNVMADSIASQDSKVWTIKIKSGWTFHNGEPVNADAYIRAWNIAAYQPNAQTGSQFFKRIDGYAALQGKAPRAKQLSGLKKISDDSFQVTLKQPFAGFPVTLGYTVFMPMAKACADDLKACDEKPIGNGPFAIDGAWEHGSQIKLVRYNDYKGTKPKLERLTFKIYDKIDTAYNDFVAGNLDVMRSLPPAAVPEARTKLGDRLIERASPSFAYIGLPVYLKQFRNKKLRQALSTAIDRQPIINEVFQGRFIPAKSFSPPSFPGGRDGTCGYCDFNPDKAKQLLAEAGGWPAGKKLELWFNSGSGHEVWMQAIGEQLKKHLGIDYELKGNLQLDKYLQTADANKFTGAFRLSWTPDYPLNENYLDPLYGAKGPPNTFGYNNPSFDAKIDKGDRAKSLDEAAVLYREAEDIIGEDMPAIPLWFGKTSVAFSEKVTDVSINGIEGVDFVAIGVRK